LFCGTQYCLVTKSSYQLLPKLEKVKSHIPDKNHRKKTHPKDFGLETPQISL
jgi:hypothetical protein